MNKINEIEISFIVVFRNESSHITNCIQSILDQNYPLNKLELILVDSMSTDDSREKIEEILKLTTLKYRFFENRKEFLSSGWNIGISKAIGEYVVRIDGHATIDRNFLINSISHIKNNKQAVGVGGLIITDSGNSKIIKNVLSSKFGVGNSKFRSSDYSGESETIVYGLYLRDVFNEVGFFNEGLKRTQDVDFHSRLRAKGYKIFQYNDIISYYYSRNTLKKLFKQAFNNGMWTMINFLRSPKRMPFRYFIPFVFTSSLLLLSILSFFVQNFLYILAFEGTLYIVTSLYFSLKKTKSPLDILRMQVTFFILHMSYGIGSTSAIALYPYIIRKVKKYE